MAIFQTIPQKFYKCNDGTYSDHMRPGACNFHCGLESNTPVTFNAGNNDVVNISLENILTARDLFQGRKEAFSSRSVTNIVQAVKNGTFRWSNFDAITLWANSADGNLYILSGHSRKEAFTILCREGYEVDGKPFCSIPSKIEQNISIEEAQKIALESNTLTTAETDIERAKYYRSLREGGTTEKEIEKDIKRNEGRNATNIKALSYLNPSGKMYAALIALENGEASSRTIVKNVARWIGNARKRFFPLTNLHEDEIYDWLISDNGFGTQKNQISNERQFIDRLTSIINRRTEFGNIQESLNIKNLLSKSPSEKQFDIQVDELQKSIRESDKELKSKIQNLTQRDATAEQVRTLTQGLEAKIRKQRIELSQLLQKKSQVLEQAKNEVSLFDSINGTPISIGNTLIYTGIIISGIAALKFFLNKN